jgi:hypothetical protein
MGLDWEELSKTLGPQGAAYTGERRTIADQVPFTRRQPGETYRQKEQRLVGIGWHPTGIGRLGATPETSCGGCVFLVRSPYGDSSYRCRRMMDRWKPGRSTRCLRDWPACEHHRPREVADE